MGAAQKFLQTSLAVPTLTPAEQARIDMDAYRSRILSKSEAGFEFGECTQCGAPTRYSGSEHCRSCRRKNGLKNRTIREPKQEVSLHERKVLKRTPPPVTLVPEPWGR